MPSAPGEPPSDAGGRALQGLARPEVDTLYGGCEPGVMSGKYLTVVPQNKTTLYIHQHLYSYKHFYMKYC